MIRVLQIVNIMDRAGLETMLMNYYRNIDRNHVQFDFLTHREAEGAYDKEIISLGGHIYHAPRLYPQNYIAYFRYMKLFFAAHPEYRVVHSHIDTMSAFPLLAAKINGVPIRISHSHSSKLDIDSKYILKYLAKVVVPKVANVYCACGKVAGQFLYGKRKFRVIHNAIDLEKFEFDAEMRKKVRKRLGIEFSLVVGHVGRYSYIKNQIFLLSVFEEVYKSKPNAKLLLIGNGEDESLLKKRVTELGFEDKVLFLMDCSNVTELYQAMDVFVMPSLFEGLPVVGVEAQANGLTCFVSDKISKEIILSDYIQLLDISKAPSFWAKQIVETSNARNIDVQKQLRKGDYDVSYEAEKLGDWYQELYSESFS